MTIKREYRVTATCNDCGKSESAERWRDLRSRGWRVADPETHYCREDAKRHPELPRWRREVSLDMREALNLIHAGHAILGPYNDFTENVVGTKTMRSLERKALIFCEGEHMYTTELGENLVKKGKARE